MAAEFLNRACGASRDYHHEPEEVTSHADSTAHLSWRILCSERMVCHDPGCSLFYAKRFCGPCAAQNKPAFPQQLHQVSWGARAVCICLGNFRLCVWEREVGCSPK